MSATADTQSIRGVLPVVHMPYHEDLSIDFDTLHREVDYLFDTGAHGLCLALVSDTLRLTAQERLELPARLAAFAGGRGPVVISVGAESTVQAPPHAPARLAAFAGGRGPVVISVGAESTVQARAYARAAEDGGAGALMAIPPLSQGLAEPQLAEYFESLLEEVSLPIFVQDASGYVGKPMSLDFQADLFRRHGQRILFKPEAAPLGPCISALRDLTGGRAAVFEGSGGVLLIDSYRRGVTGTIPGVELLDGLVALWNACEAGDWERAYQIYFPICAMATLQMQGGLDGYIVTERYLMNRQGLFPNQVHRGPLAFRLDDETRQEIDRLYDRLQGVLKG